MSNELLIKREILEGKGTSLDSFITPISVSPPWNTSSFAILCGGIAPTTAYLMSYLNLTDGGSQFNSLVQEINFFYWHVSKMYLMLRLINCLISLNQILMQLFFEEKFVI